MGSNLGSCMQAWNLSVRWYRAETLQCRSLELAVCQIDGVDKFNPSVNLAEHPLVFPRT